MAEEDNQRAKKACIACRKQKMKCVLDGRNASCRRCQRMEIACIFQTRANAAVLPSPVGTQYSQDLRDPSVYHRLARIERVLGLSTPESPEASNTSPNIELNTNGGLDDPSTPLLDSATLLKAHSRPEDNPAAWRKDTVERLWEYFHASTPDFHFLPEKPAFTAPVPLLLASILYCASTRGLPDVATYSEVYYRCLCLELSRLALPGSNHHGRSAEIGDSIHSEEERTYQTVIGIILAVLLTEGCDDVTGLWLSMAYRLTLRYCPRSSSSTARNWPKVLLGLQILDLEHASLRLSRPAISQQVNLTSTRDSQHRLHGLTRMMHVGLSHFADRGFPTIMSQLLIRNTDQPVVETAQTTLSGVDAAVIRDWARQLDEWLAQMTNDPPESMLERLSMYRQYVMHRLCVLSIYLPSKPQDLFPANGLPTASLELLHSARVCIKLHADDLRIWANWDVVIISWAALIVLQAVRGGYGEPADLSAIRLHVQLLRQAHEPTSNLRHRLADRLDADIMDTGVDDFPNVLVNGSLGVDISTFWPLFDEASLQFVDQYC